MLTVVTYAGGKPCWLRSAERLRDQALGSDIVSSVNVWSKPMILERSSPMFRQAKRLSEKHPKGDGLWSWKIPILWESFEKLKIGETLLYIDAGSTINNSTYLSRERFRSYLDLARENGQLFFSQPGMSELHWSKQSLRKFDSTDLVWNGDQRLGGILFLNKHESSQRFLDMALEMAMDESGEGFLDPLESEMQLPEFKEHRHDQSIISIASKAQNAYAITDETYFAPKWRVDGADYPIWATRLCSGWNLTGHSFPHRVLREIERKLPF